MESDTTPQPDPLLPPETGDPGMELPPDGVPVVIMAVPVSMETWFLPGVPLARPMSVLPCVGYTPARQDHEMSALRAIVEIILVIPIGIAGAVVAYLLTHQWGPSDERWLRIADTMGLGFGAMLACMAIVWIGRRRLSTIGITLRRFPIEIGLGIASWIPTWMMLIPLSLVLTVLLREQPTAQKAIEENFPHLSLRQMFLVCLAVALYEEVLFRGFLLTRLHAICRRWWLAVPIGAILFGSLHLYEGIVAVGAITFLGVVLGTLFVWRKSLLAPITVHLIHNFLMFMLLDYVSQTWE